MNRKIFFPLAWVAIVVGLLGVLGFQVHRGIEIETNIFNLLPSFESNPIVKKSVARFSDQISHQVLFLIGHPEEKQARKAAKIFAASLRKSGQFQSVQAELKQDQQQEWFTFYFPHRYQIISPEIRTLLQQEDAFEQLFQRLHSVLFGPLPQASGAILSEDPLLLFPSFLLSLPPPPGKVTFQNGMMMLQDSNQTYIVVIAVTRDDPFDIQNQSKLISFVDTEIQKLHHNFQNLSLLYTGVLRFAAAGVDAAQRELSTIGVGSLLGIILLILITFRSLQQFFYAFLAIGVGFLCALVVCLLVFPKLHLLTLVLGSSLIGVCIDYAFHYFVEHRLSQGPWDSWEGLKHIFPGITMGVLTSIMGYVGFVLTPFPVLRQMALFSAVGLLGAYLTVVCWFPVLLKRGHAIKESSIILKLPSHFLSLWNQLRNQKWIQRGLGVLCIILLFQMTDLTYDDDIRSLQNLPPSLKREDAQIRKLIGGFDVSRFIVIQADNTEDLLHLQEEATFQLKKLQSKGELSFFQSLTPFLPSIQQQQQNYQLIRQAILPQSHKFLEHLEDLGFEAEVGQKMLAQLTPTSPDFVTIDQWLQSPISTPLKHLWLGEEDQGVASMILLSGDHDEAKVKEALTLPGVHYINQVEAISQLFAQYRREASQLVGIAYIGIFFFLLWRYGLKKGYMIMAPPVLAAFLTLSTLALLQEPLHLMHILSLLLVLGIGIDYTIFLVESTQSLNATMLAILLSALTTILSFGLLFLSQTPALQAVGATITLGISFSLLLCPLPIATKPLHNFDDK